MRAIVSGATGYLGVELSARLAIDGVDLHAILRPESDAGRLLNRVPDIALHRYDGSQSGLSAVLATVQPDTVFHLAGKYVRDETSADVPELIAANITFGSQLLEACRRTGIKRFINTGSHLQFCDHGTGAVNFYAAAKGAFAEVLAYYSGLGVFRTTSLILFDTYGPGDWRHKLIPTLAAAQKQNIGIPLANEALQLYPVYVSDVVDCYLLAAQILKDDPAGIHAGDFAVRGAEPSTIGDLVRTFEHVSGRPVPVVRGAWADQTDKFRPIWRGTTLPGWEPRHVLKEGLRKCIQSCRPN